MATKQAEQMCFLCNKILLSENKIRVKQRGIRSLIVASLRKKDGKHKLFRTVSSLDIHKNCHLMYTIKKNTKTYRTKSYYLGRKKQSKGAKNFDFVSNCFLCSNKVNILSKSVHVINQDKTVQKIFDRLEKRKADGQEQDYDEILLARLKSVDNLIQAKARYHNSCMSNFRSHSKISSGQSLDEEMKTAIQHVINTIFENEDECQFSLKAIFSTFDGQEIPEQRIVPILKDYFGDEVKIHSEQGDTIICFSDAVNSVPNDSWYNDRAKNVSEDQSRIVQTAANIVLRDIQTRLYKAENCDTAASSEDVTSDVPESLKLFLDVLIKSHKTKNSASETDSKWLSKIVVLAHILISSVRSRSFLSPILMGITQMMKEKGTPDDLIDDFANLGLCANQKILHFKNLNSEQFALSDDPFWKFLFNNFDQTVGVIGNDNSLAIDNNSQTINDYLIISDDDSSIARSDKSIARDGSKLMASGDNESITSDDDNSIASDAVTTAIDDVNSIAIDQNSTVIDDANLTAIDDVNSEAIDQNSTATDDENLTAIDGANSIAIDYNSATIDDANSIAIDYASLIATNYENFIASENANEMAIDSVNSMAGDYTNSTVIDNSSINNYEANSITFDNSIAVDNSNAMAIDDYDTTMINYINTAIDNAFSMANYSDNQMPVYCGSSIALNYNNFIATDYANRMAIDWTNSMAVNSANSPAIDINTETIDYVDLIDSDDY